MQNIVLLERLKVKNDLESHYIGKSYILTLKCVSICTLHYMFFAKKKIKSFSFIMAKLLRNNFHFHVKIRGENQSF